ncbi:MAG TPA: response regulator transcription factor [Acidimicrobiales bacterium]
MHVRVRLGPLPAHCARAWLGYARSVLDAIERGDVTSDVAVDPAIVPSFRRYLSEWDQAASGLTFKWVSVEERDALSRLATAWLDLMAQMSGRFVALGLGAGPPDGEPFYHGLVAAIGEALAGGDEQLGDKLQEAWPAIGRIAKHADGASGRLTRVVIADDASDLRLVIRIALEQDGRFAVVGEAGDGEEVVEVARRERPDLVLLDIVMPRVDGWTALTMLREACPDAKVVVVSTLDAATAAPRAKELGAAAYVQKSISLTTLTDTLAGLAA